MKRQPSSQQLEKLFIAFYNHLECIVECKKEKSGFARFCLGHSWLGWREETNEKNSFVHEKRVNIYTKHSCIEYYYVAIAQYTVGHRYSKYANVITQFKTFNWFIYQMLILIQYLKFNLWSKIQRFWSWKNFHLMWYPTFIH